LAKVTIPVLSKTLMSARSTAMNPSTKRKAEQCKRAARFAKVQ
jgi:hypothetical protein